MQGHPLRRVDTFVYLGILMGFAVSCTDAITHRVARAVAAFHGLYRILGRVGRDVCLRLRLFHVFVTSKWRWMSPGVRPTGPAIRMLNWLHLTYLTSIIYEACM